MKEKKHLKLGIKKLFPNKKNPNQLSEEHYAKLKKNIKRSGQYPALIVRPKGEVYEIIDGYHRWMVLQELGYKEVDCEVWDVDDREVSLLLTTLNRLRGTDEPKRRARLLVDVFQDFGAEIDVLKLIPESDRSLMSLINTLKSDGDIDIESEQGLVEEQLMQAGVDPETSKRIASKHKLPGEKATMRFVFFDDKAYNRAVKVFGVKPNTQLLMELVDIYEYKDNN